MIIIYFVINKSENMFNKDYFKTYNKYIKFKDLKEGNSYKEGDKLYLVKMEF